MLFRLPQLGTAVPARWRSQAGFPAGLTASEDLISGRTNPFSTNDVSVIDTSSITSKDPLGHNAFADSPEIIRLLGRRLAGQSLAGREASFADRVGVAAANFAGSAARVAVAAPVSVVSREAREVLKRELSPSTGQIVDGQISY
jgi:hypothetical protein